MNKFIKELEPYFSQILDYLGDDELISSVNDEYNFGPNDMVLTDGIFISYLAKAINNKSEFIELITSIRGASYVIIVDFVDRKPMFDLRVDESKLDENLKNKIIQEVQKIKDNMDDCIYHMEEYRGEIVEDNMMYI